MKRLLLFSSLFLCLFIIQCECGKPGKSTRPITNEDIRDVLLTALHLIKNTSDKLERHEFREKNLGDNLRKDLNNLAKEQNILQVLYGVVQRLDERLANVETVLMENEKQQHIQNIVFNNTINTLVDSVVSLGTIISEKVGVNNVPELNSLTKEVKDIRVTTNDIQQKLKSHSLQLKNLDKSTTTVVDILTQKSSNVAIVLEKYENKLNELNKFNPDSSISYKEPISIDDNHIMTMLNDQQSTLQQILNSVKNCENQIMKLPTATNLATLFNNTMTLLQQTKYDLNERNDKNIDNIYTQLKEINVNLLEYTDNSNSTYNQLTDLHRGFYAGTAKSYQQLHSEIQSLPKIEKVLLQTSDSILEIKRRIEYGIHQILLEVGDLVKVQGNALNGTVNKRFDDIELTILDNQTGALANLTTKFETEMSQVWRQIGVMYQQVTASNTALDRLQAQTENYVNGSLSTMDSMEGKVGKINTRMAEVDSNLNYLLGRLSLVTHDFNQIKLGLGNALDQIRSSFMTVQDKVNKVKDIGPGPHQIPDVNNDIDTDKPKDT